MLGLVLFLLEFSASNVHGDICCTPDQFEGFIYMDTANVFIDANVGTAYMYTNSSTQVAYDYTRRAIYLNMTGVELSPLLPQPVPVQYTIISDYVKGVQYQFTADHCDKQPIGAMRKLCIPDNAIQRSYGFMGQNETQVVTYQYTYPGSSLTYITTINPTACLPLTHTLLGGDVVPDSGFMTSMLISDITLGIKDPSVFIPPKICLTNRTGPIEKNNLSNTIKRLRRIGRIFLA